MSRGRHIQTRRPNNGIRRHVCTVALVVCAFLVASAGAAFAYLSATGSGSASAKATTLGAGSQPSATVSGRDVSLSWSAFTNATSYTVARSNVSPQSLSTTLNGTCASSPSGTSCTDTGVVENGSAATNWTYAETPNVHNWVGGASPASATVTIPGPTLSVGSTSVTTAGGTASNVTVANYFDNETVTYCVDNDSTSCPAADMTTPATAAVPATGGTVTTSSLTIPSGLSAGSHTLFAKGSNGSDPTGASFTVTSAGTAPAITSAASISLFTGTAGSFTVTTTGSPTPALTNANFAGCTKTATLPTGVTFTDNGNGTATIASTTSSPAGTTTFCINAANGVSPNATQAFALTIDTGKLVITSTAGSVPSSGTPNLGAITVQRQNGAGTPITTGGALTVNLSSSPSSGATFGTTQFDSTTVTSVTIASGASTTTFWYGLATAGTPTITVSATNYVSGTQQETINTTAPAGLALENVTGGSASCGTIGTSYTCNISGTGSGGSATFKVAFVNSSGTPVIYSATQASTISESGQNTGTTTVAANATTSSTTLTASHTGNATKTSTLTFGPYTLTINVSS